MTFKLQKKFWKFADWIFSPSHIGYLTEKWLVYD